MKIPGKKLKQRLKGFTLIEVIVAVAILSIIGSGLLGGLILASRTLLSADTRETARDLAQAQMESIQKQEYDTSLPLNYSQITALPTGYSVSIMPERIDEDGNPSSDDIGIQKITITVQDGTGDFSLEGRKVNW